MAAKDPPPRKRRTKTPDELRAYARKRDFARTPEPGPKKRARRDEAPLEFVVHRHEARNLHYDLRFRVGGALASFAVPKGFSYDPKEKRLAVRTEEHPLEYLEFEGTIPRGEYGGGTMTVWDRGRFAPVVGPGIESDLERSLAKGEVKLHLFGRRLRGEWHLVKTKQAPNTWLLFKSKDRYAGPARDSVLGVDLARAEPGPLPRSLAFMEPKRTVAPFSDAEWLFELSFAGKRVLAVKEGAEARVAAVEAPLASWNPALAADLLQLRAEKAALDGVLVALDADGRPSRTVLDAALRAALDGANDRAAPPVFLYVFDVVHFDGFDLRPLPQIDRKAALRTLLPEATKRLMFVDHVAGLGEQLAASVADAGLRGLIAKRASAPYEPGASDAWRAIAVAPSARKRAGAKTKRTKRTKSAGAAGQTSGAASRVKLTNLGKVWFPAEGITKGEILAYYERVAGDLLPYLKERPVHMNRFPDGIEGKSFYQRHMAENLPDWIPQESVASRSKGKDLHFVICNERDALLYLVNLGSIDLHPWLSRRPRLDEPDLCILDLDAKQATFEGIVRMAKEAGKLLRGIGLRPLLKTSGKTGMHVVVPLIDGFTYDQSRMFCEAVARVLAREFPDVATVERTPGARGRRVYLDFGQNRKSQTVVPPYVVRPVGGAPVSTPLQWDELEDGDLAPRRFDIHSVPARLERFGDLFRPALTDRQDLRPAIHALEAMLRRG